MSAATIRKEGALAAPSDPDRIDRPPAAGRLTVVAADGSRLEGAAALAALAELARRLEEGAAT